MRAIDAVRFDEFFSMSELPMCVGDAEGRMGASNGAWAAMLGYGPEELRGRSLLELVHEGDRQAAAEALGALPGAAGVAKTFDARLVAKDGSLRGSRWTAWLGRDDGLLYVVVRDTTEAKRLGVGLEGDERRRMEEALQRSEQKLSLHFQQTPLGVIEWNLGFEVVAWNPSAERIFGYSPEEALGRHASFIVPERVRPLVDGVFQSLVTQRGGTRSTNENVTKDGRTVLCEWYNTPLVDARGDVIGVASLVDDVTEQRRAEEALRQRERAQAATIQRLSTPVLEIWDGVLALPILGAVDGARAAQMTESLLGAIVRTGAGAAILDVTGMEGVDAASAGHLLQMVHAARLLGSRCIASGISPEVAQALVELELRFDDLTTFGRLRDALRHAIKAGR